MDEQEEVDVEKAVPTAPHVCLTPTERIARSPRLSPDGTRLAYLSNRDGEPTLP